MQENCYLEGAEETRLLYKKYLLASFALFAGLMEEASTLHEHGCSSTWACAHGSRLGTLLSGLSFSPVYIFQEPQQSWEAVPVVLSKQTKWAFTW